MIDKNIQWVNSDSESDNDFDKIKLVAPISNLIDPFKIYDEIPTLEQDFMNNENTFKIDKFVQNKPSKMADSKNTDDKNFIEENIASNSIEDLVFTNVDTLDCKELDIFNGSSQNILKNPSSISLNIEDILSNKEIVNSDSNFEDCLTFESSEDLLPSNKSNFLKNSDLPIKLVIDSITRNKNGIIIEGDGNSILVKDEWMDIDFQIGMTIFVKRSNNSEINENNILQVDSFNNFLFIFDEVISITNFLKCFRCKNTPKLKARIADVKFTFNNSALVIGNIIHEIIQVILKEKSFAVNNLTGEKLSKKLEEITSHKYFTTNLHRIIKNKTQELFTCNISESEIKNEICKQLANILKFIKTDLTIAEIEYSLMSLNYGLKGKIDCVSKDYIIEIKTGKREEFEHKSQVLLYKVMSEELNNNFYQKIPMLFYSQTGIFKEVFVKHSEIRDLIIKRNQISSQINILQCDCSPTEPCHIYNEIKKLNSKHFLRNQLEIIEKEYFKEPEYIKAKIFNKNEYSFNNINNSSIILNDFSSNFINSSQDIHQNENKYLSVKLEILKNDLLEIPNINDWIVIYSSIKKRISNGKITQISTKLSNLIILKINFLNEISLENEIFISLENSDIFYKYSLYSLLHIAYFKYIQKDLPIILPGQEFGLNLPIEESFNEELFKDDLVELNYIECSCESKRIKTVTNNNINDKIITNNKNLNDKNFYNEINKNLKNKNIYKNDNINLNNNLKNIDINNNSIDNTLNYFSQIPISQNIHSIRIPDVYKNEFLKLNDDQRNALIEGLNCENFKLIHGMPGTGKSTLIALLIKILIFYKKKVLLICYTHLAIENILLKLTSINYYKAGETMSGLIETIKNYEDKYNKKELNNYSEELKKVLNNVDLVVGTCYSFKDPIYLERSFDHCIIDEGSQISLLLSLIPISISKKFVMVGDHLQIKPIKGDSKSAFEHFLEYDKNYCQLKIQYRMCKEIMELSNFLFYSNMMILGKEKSISNEKPVVFVDTKIINYKDYISSLENCTILCYYNSQVKETQTLTKNKVSTIDKFQGSEDDEIVVVFDPIKNNECQMSKERLNVALTRARKKLILVGNKEEMLNISIFKSLLELIETYI